MTIQFDISDHLYKCLQKRIELGVASELDMLVAKGKVVDQEPCEDAISRQAVLDKIRTEIKEKYGGYDICEWFVDYDYEDNNISEYRLVGNMTDILAVIDKYKAETKIKSMTKEQNYMRGYEDGKLDVLTKIKAEIDNVLSDGMIHKKTVLGIIDKYKAEK